MTKKRSGKKPVGWRDDSDRHRMAKYGLKSSFNDKFVSHGLISLEELNNWKPGKEHIDATKDILVWESIVGTIKPIVDTYSRDILHKHDFRVSDRFSDTIDFKIIREPNHTYLMDNDDYEIYADLIEDAKDKHGFGALPDDYCPYLIAESKLTDARNRLGKLMGDVVGIDYNEIYILEHRKRMVDMSLSFLIDKIDLSDTDKLGKKYLTELYDGKVK